MLCTIQLMITLNQLLEDFKGDKVDIILGSLFVVNLFIIITDNSIYK